MIYSCTLIFMVILVRKICSCLDLIITWLNLSTTNAEYFPNFYLTWPRYSDITAVHTVYQTTNVQQQERWCWTRWWFLLFSLSSLLLGFIMIMLSTKIKLSLRRSGSSWGNLLLLPWKSIFREFSNMLCL